MISFFRLEVIKYSWTYTAMTLDAHLLDTSRRKVAGVLDGPKREIE